MIRIPAAAWKKAMTPTTRQEWGAGPGIFKTTDGGKNWHKCKGLPTNNIGRIGLDYYRDNPNEVFAIIDSRISAWEGHPRPARIFSRRFGEDAEGGLRLVRVVTAGRRPRPD